MGKDKKTDYHNDLTTHFAFLPMIEDKRRRHLKKNKKPQPSVEWFVYVMLLQQKVV